VTIPDYYSVLGVSPDASSKEIHTVYRELALKYHPDRNGGDPESEERLKEINQAYHMLGNEDRRRQYDLQVRGPFQTHLFEEADVDNRLFNLLWRFSQVSGGPRGFGGCRGRGFGRGGCGRWKR